MASGSADVLIHSDSVSMVPQHAARSGQIQKRQGIMFSKSKEAETALTSQPAPQAKRTARNGGVPSVISAELIVRGTLISAGDVQVDGKIDGDIRAAGLVIGEKAIIVGDVYAEEASIRGRVEGSIRA